MRTFRYIEAVEAELLNTLFLSNTGVSAYDTDVKEARIAAKNAAKVAVVADYSICVIM